MTVDPQVTPPTSHSAYGYVTGCLIRRSTDDSDPDDLPTIRAAMNVTGEFVPKRGQHRTSDYPALLIEERVPFTVGPNGYIRDGMENSPIALGVGDWKATFSGPPGVTVAPIEFSLTEAHTKAAPLNLYSLVPPTPPGGQQPAYMLVPPTIPVGHLLSVGADGLVGVDPATLGGGSGGSTAWADITDKPSAFPPEVEATQDIVGAMVAGAGGTYDDAAGTVALPGEVEQVTLTEDLAYTLPAGVGPNRTHSVVFTQDATGGHTVTLGGVPLDVDTAPGARTLVQMWPVGGGDYVAVYPASAGGDAPTTPSEAWAHWGDSMTASGSSGDWVTKLAAVSGADHYNGGVGGETAAQIAARMTGAAGAAYRDRRFTLSGGRNGFKATPAASIVASLRQMFDHSTPKQGLVLDVPPFTGDTSGDTTTREALNDAIAAEFPDHYYAVFAALLTEAGRLAAGHVWTVPDLADITAGWTPASFRSDTGHLNPLGGRAVANLIAQQLHTRGLIDVAPVLPVGATVTNLVKYPRPTQTAISNAWTAYGGGTIPVTNDAGAYTEEALTWSPTGEGVRLVGAATSTVANGSIELGATPTRRINMNGGENVAASMWVQCSKQVTVRLRIRSRAAGTAPVVGDIFGGDTVIPANKPTRLTLVGVLPSSGPLDLSLALMLGGTVDLSDGSTLEAAAPMVTQGSTIYQYADGASPGWAWDGTPYESPSTGTSYASV